MAKNRKVAGILSKNKVLDAIREEDFEDTMNDGKKSVAGELDDIFNKLEMQDEDRGDSDFAYNGADDFDEDAHAEVLDKLGLMDREAYVDLLK